jgi:hypothetical protein
LSISDHDRGLVQLTERGVDGRSQACALSLSKGACCASSV